MAEMSAEAQRLKRLMEERGLSAQEMVRRTGFNKNTFSDLFSGKTQRPSKRVLDGLEAALGVTPGTLVGGGEDTMRLGAGHLGRTKLGADLSRASSSDLLSALTAKVMSLEARLADLEQAERVRVERRKEYLSGIGERSTEHEQWIHREWMDLVYASQESDWGSEEARMAELLEQWLDVLWFASEHDVLLTSAGDDGSDRLGERGAGSPPEPLNYREVAPEAAEPPVDLHERFSPTVANAARIGRNATKLRPDPQAGVGEEDQS